MLVGKYIAGSSWPSCQHPRIGKPDALRRPIERPMRGMQEVWEASSYSKESLQFGSYSLPSSLRNTAKMTYVVASGGVVSGIGKGVIGALRNSQLDRGGGSLRITASSNGSLLRTAGLKTAANEIETTGTWHVMRCALLQGSGACAKHEICRRSLCPE